jgi:hypothetical protein
MRLSDPVIAEVNTKFNRDLADIERDIRVNSAQIIASSPVDTGHFRRSWTFKKVSDDHFVLHNPVKYASILYHGRRFVKGRWYGSEQLPKGYEPILREFAEKIGGEFND